MRTFPPGKAFVGISRVGSPFGDRGADEVLCRLIALGSPPRFLRWSLSGGHPMALSMKSVSLTLQRKLPEVDSNHQPSG